MKKNMNKRESPIHPTKGSSFDIEQYKRERERERERVKRNDINRYLYITR
jgi:hypothetical protein